MAGKYLNKNEMGCETNELYRVVATYQLLNYNAILHYNFDIQKNLLSFSFKKPLNIYLFQL